MNNVMDYAGYVHARKLERGTKAQRMKDTGKWFDINYGNPEGSFKNGETLYLDTPRNSPMTGIKKNLCFEFYGNTKTPDEIAVLLAYLAVKSILGDKPYICITNAFLVARMGGYAGVKDMPKTLPKPLAEHYTRRKLDRIKKELQINWGVNIYSNHIKGFYISMEKTITLEKLILEVEKRRRKAIDDKLKKRVNDARKKAIQQLETWPN